MFLQKSLKSRISKMLFFRTPSWIFLLQGDDLRPVSFKTISMLVGKGARCVTSPNDGCEGDYIFVFFWCGRRDKTHRDVCVLKRNAKCAQGLN